MRNAKLSQCETVRNVSYGLRWRPQAGERCETSFAQAISAKFNKLNAQTVKAKCLTGSNPAKSNCSAMFDADTPAHKKRKAGGRPADERI